MPCHDYNAAPGTSLTETDRELRQVEQILRANPAVRTYSRRTGLQLGSGLTEANQGDFFVRLKPFPRPPIDTVMADVRQQVARTIPALRIETSQLMEDLIGDLTGVPQPVDSKLFSPDENALLTATAKVEMALNSVKRIIEVKGIVRAGDALNIEVDRVKYRSSTWLIASGFIPSNAAFGQVTTWSKKARGYSAYGCGSQQISVRPSETWGTLS